MDKELIIKNIIYFTQENTSILKDYLYLDILLTDIFDNLPEDFNKTEFLNLLKQKLEKESKDIEINYPEEAIDFLKEKDPKLLISLNLAKENNIPINKVNSVILANLLLKQIINEEIKKILKFAKSIID
jgi:hypothetical protein